MPSPTARLPSELVGIDVIDLQTHRFLAVDERDSMLRTMSIEHPPRRFRGRPQTLAELDWLFGRSAFTSARAEGLIIRTADGRSPRVAKHVDPSWGKIGEAPWAGTNRLALA